MATISERQFEAKVISRLNPYDFHLGAPTHDSMDPEKRNEELRCFAHDVMVERNNFLSLMLCVR
jgi:hypothetical protein